MKKFLLNSLYFISPILLFGYSLDVFISENLKKSNSFVSGEYTVWNDVLEGKINSDLLIYGSSRAWVNISPEILGKKLHTTTYNLGIDGHNFWLQNLRHKQLLKFNKKPKTIIYVVDIITLQQNTELFNYEQFFPYMLWNNYFKNTILPKNDIQNFEFSLPLLRYSGRYKAIRTAFEMALYPEKNPVQRIRGYQGQELSWNKDLEKAEKKLGSINAVLSAKVIKKFEYFLQECKKDKINVILVYSPEFIEGQKFIENKKDIIMIYNKLSKKYEIPFYDFSGDKMCSNRNLFYNSTHMNKIGAEQFSNQLADTLLKYGYDKSFN